MPLPKYPDNIMRAIYTKYCPVVPGPKPKDGAERPLIPDPDVLYVGPLIDGICLYAPQIVGKATWPSEGGVDDRRRRLKHLLSSVGASGRAMNWNARNARLAFVREGKPAVNLGNRIIEMEPGELLNSYTLIQDSETGEILPWELLHKRDAEQATTRMGDRPAKPFDPVIREDKRIGLHYLRRGDKLIFDYVKRRFGPIHMEFVLRPLSEGESLLTPEATAGVLEW